MKLNIISVIFCTLISTVAFSKISFANPSQVIGHLSVTEGSSGTNKAFNVYEGETWGQFEDRVAQAYGRSGKLIVNGRELASEHPNELITPQEVHNLQVTSGTIFSSK
jgi:hypothetical protein